MRNSESGREATETIDGQPVEVFDEQSAFYADYGDELLKGTIPFLNDTLRSLLTVSTSLMGGGIAFLNDKLVDGGLKVVALVFFFAAMIVSFIGILPFTAWASRHCGDEIEKAVRDGTARKRALVLIAWIFILFGMLVALIGVFVKTNV